jgi:predicted ATPase
MSEPVRFKLPTPKPKVSLPRITRVVLRNYRSIEAADVTLGALSVLVGANGAGKSNFLDALRFTADALRSGLENALEERGGIQEVRRRSSGHPTHFSLRLDVDLGGGVSGFYAFDVGARKPAGFVIKREQCELGALAFDVKEGKVTRFSGGRAPASRDDSLFLANASGFPGFDAMYRALTSIAVYNLNPEEIRELQKPDSGAILRRDGRNIATILRSMPPSTKDRIVEYLRAVVPGIKDVSRVKLGPSETLQFVQEDEAETRKFYAANMSDGTLRALGVLTAVLQPSSAIFVGIEEPEIALHPAAAHALRDCLLEASERRQIAITSHSPELLDDKDWDADSILGVDASGGSTIITHLSRTTRNALRDNLLTAGDLLRAGQLVPDIEQVPKVGQLRLFEGAAQ